MDMDFEWHTRDEKLLVVAYWWEKQERKCCICGDEMGPYHRDDTRDANRATIEHLIPRRENGPNTVGNVRLAHAICNHTLGSLWTINKHRQDNGLPPLTDRWAINTARGNMRALAKQDAMTPGEKAQVEHQRKIEKQERMERGILWRSLPRGATLLPEYASVVAAIIATDKHSGRKKPKLKRYEPIPMANQPHKARQRT